MLPQILVQLSDELFLVRYQAPWYRTRKVHKAAAFVNQACAQFPIFGDTVFVCLWVAHHSQTSQSIDVFYQTGESSIHRETSWFRACHRHVFTLSPNVTIKDRAINRTLDSAFESFPRI